MLIPSLCSFIDSLISLIDWASTFVFASISVRDFWVLSASFLTSSATTAKPLPCSPARAASIAALRASKFVWSAISLIIVMMFLISSLCLITSDVFWDIAFIELDICSTAAADSWSELACTFAPWVSSFIDWLKASAFSSSTWAWSKFALNILAISSPRAFIPTAILPSSSSLLVKSCFLKLSSRFNTSSPFSAIACLSAICKSLKVCFSWLSAGFEVSALSWAT